MKVTASPLQILDFAILKFEMEYVAITKEIELKELFSGYNIDLDFSIDDSDGILRVFMKSGINQGKKKEMGYSVFAECACLFQFDEKISISHNEKDSLQSFSAIYITLNALRGFISNFTVNGPMGRYILPSIDLNKLIDEKKKLSIKKISNKKSTTSKTKVATVTKKKAVKKNK